MCIPINDVQNGTEILVDDFDPEAHAKQTLVQKAEDARHHAARMLRQTKVHNPDAVTSSHDEHQHVILPLHFECRELYMLQVISADLQACLLCSKKHVVVQAIDVIQSVQKQQHAESLASIQKADNQ